MREAGFFILSGQLRLAKTAMESLLRRGKATPGLVAALAHTYLSLERPSQARHVINQFGGMLGSAPTESAAYLPLAFPIRFVDEVRAAAAVAGIPPEFLAAVVRHESNFNPKIKSWAGAIGLTQLMPRTAKAVAARHMPELSRARNRLRDPKINLQIGAFFLADLLKRYKGDEVRTLVAYNAGSGALYKSLKSAPKLPEEVQLDAIALRSAVAYARRVINARNIYRQIFGAELQRRQPTRPSQWSR
jgi:soluble lytic murein transglycosylase-like protein